MSSSDFQAINIVDSGINDITDKLIVPVYSGPSNCTYQRFAFNSNSNSSLTINVQVPSESIAINPRVLLTGQLNLTFTLGDVPASKSCFQYGLTDSLSSYALSSLFTQVSLQINNSLVSTNYQDLLPFFRLLEDKEKIDRRNSTSPNTTNELWGMWNDAVLSNSNPMSSINESNYDDARIPNGSVPANITVIHYIGGSPTNTDSSLISTGLNDTWTIYFSTKNNLTEPFIGLSPFVSDDENHSALIGINTLSMTINLNQCQRVWQTGNSFVNSNATGLTGYIKSISLGNPNNPNGISNAALLFNFNTLSSLQYSKISTKSVITYNEYARFITPNSAAPLLQPNQTGTITYSNLQLGQIPQLLVFGVRKPMNLQTWLDTDSLLAINSITLTINNTSGVLASASTFDLYNVSVASGSKQSWYSFSGYANSVVNGEAKTIPTLGSMMCINLAKFGSLNELLTNGSLGQINLLIQVNVTNQYPYAIQPECITFCNNMGACINQLGSTSLMTGLIDMQTTLDAREQEKHSVIDEELYKREVGGLHKGIGAFGKYVRKHMGHVITGNSKSDGDEEDGGYRHKKTSISKKKLHKLLR